MLLDLFGRSMMLAAGLNYVSGSACSHHVSEYMQLEQNTGMVGHSRLLDTTVICVDYAPQHVLGKVCTEASALLGCDSGETPRAQSAAHIRTTAACI